MFEEKVSFLHRLIKLVDKFYYFIVEIVIWMCLWVINNKRTIQFRQVPFVVFLFFIDVQFNRDNQIDINEVLFLVLEVLNFAPDLLLPLETACFLKFFELSFQLNYFLENLSLYFVVLLIFVGFTHLTNFFVEGWNVLGNHVKFSYTAVRICRKFRKSL